MKSRLQGKPNASLQDARQLGSIYEARLRDNPAGRKANGCFYTPQSIVDYIIVQALKPVLNRKLRALQPAFQQASRSDARLVERLFDFRILDPSMGAGYFLLAAAEYVTGRMLAFLAKQTRNPVSSKLGDHRRLRQRVTESCIFGVDIDPAAVEVARRSLAVHGSVSCLTEHLRHGDALKSASFDGKKFDVVLGNPPHGAVMDTSAREELSWLSSNADTAAGFLQRGLELTRPGGRVGFVLPKPLTYSYAWRRVRAGLRGQVYHLADLGRAWQEVRLEQVIVVAGPRRITRDHYLVSALRAGRFEPPQAMPRRWADRFGTLPCALDVDELARLNQLPAASATVGQLCKTYRGLPAQRQLVSEGAIHVIGGRDLDRWRVRSCSGCLPADQDYDVSVFRGPKLVFQNIIAHISRPTPHIRLTGAYDRTGIVTLDTVNNLVPRTPGVNLWGVLALLHSDFINWFVYAVVYNKAIRTMHFDQYFLDKIPLPLDPLKLLKRLAPLARRATRLVERARSRDEDGQRKVTREINRMVNEAYRLPPPGTSHFRL